MVGPKVFLTYLTVRQQLQTSIHSQALMETALGVLTSSLRVLQSGVSTNWWGLACPAHCGAPSFGLVAAAFLAGCLATLLSLSALAIWTFGFSLPHPQVAPAPHPISRLSRYLDEPARFRSRGRGT